MAGLETATTTKMEMPAMPDIDTATGIETVMETEKRMAPVNECQKLTDLEQGRASDNNNTNSWKYIFTNDETTSTMDGNENIDTCTYPFMCPICCFEFKHAFMLEIHVKIHRQREMKSVHECSECGKVFKVASALKRHTGVHSDDRPYRCKQCGKTYKTHKGLQYHVSLHDYTEPKPHKCDLCEKCFRDPVGLMYHMKKHTGDLPYKCTQCGKGFPKPSKLQRHLKLHSDEKSHMCEYCGQQFKMRGNLDIHKRKHTGERLWKCELCPATFLSSYHLKRHAYTHTKEKPLMCSKCGKGFVQATSLKIHTNSDCGTRKRRRVAPRTVSSVAFIE